MKQPLPETEPTIAAAVIVNGDRVLLVRRRVAEGSLSWQFPAGAIEPGETAEQAAVRETSEEAGLTVRGRQWLGERKHPATGRTMVYVACEVVDGQASVRDDEELDQVAWLTRDQLREHVPHGFYEPVQQYINEALDGRASTQLRDRRLGREKVTETRANDATVQEFRQENATGFHPSGGHLADGRGR